MAGSVASTYLIKGGIDAARCSPIPTSRSSDPRICSRLRSWSPPARSSEVARPPSPPNRRPQARRLRCTRRRTESASFSACAKSTKASDKGDYMLLEYAAAAKLYVPLTRMDLVQKFRGAGEARLRRSTGWAAPHGRAPNPASKRKCATWPRSCSSCTPAPNWPRVSHSPPTATGSASSKTPSSSPKRATSSRPSTTSSATWKTATPMDRLLCGDVGFGKTEVAMRAAFKALGDGKQVAVLAPTTVLAFQHFETFKRRFAHSPCASKC